MSYKETDTSPLGIKVVCAVVGIGVLGGVFLGLELVFVASRTELGWLAVGLGLALLALELLHVPMIYGLWTLQPWGWRYAMVLLGIGLAVNLLSVLGGNALAFPGLIVTGAVAMYVYDKRDLFARYG